jgi:competence protein CoiA
MHLFALDSQGQIVPVHRAQKQKNYFCLECRGSVRRRAGLHRTSHFFHLNPASSCRQEGKSMAHLQIQYRLQSMLPAKDCFLEYSFPVIQRVADVVWISKKIIFEVQCSPIHPDEIKSRNQDYASQGFQVVWILHDQRYNQWKISAAEDYLQNSPYYFTDINGEGKGIIYDQLHIVDKGIRKKKLLSCNIDVSGPRTMASNSRLQTTNLPAMIAKRIQSWPLYFLGDLVYKGIHDYDEAFEKCCKEENEILKLAKGSFLNRLKLFFHYGVARPYDLIFKMLLEKVCR